MDAAAYNAQIQKIANALWAVEAYMGTGGRMQTLHRELATGLAMLQADNPALVSPAGGTSKPKPSA